MEFEEVQQFWEGVEGKFSVFKADPILRFFDEFSILEVVEGKVLKFDVEKIAELQDKVDKTEPTPQDAPLREIFAPGATKNINVRTHKLIKVIKDSLTSLCESGELPRAEEPASPPRGNAQPQQATASPPQAPASQQQQQQQQQAANAPEPRMLALVGQPMELAADLPEGARLNVREQPDSDAPVVCTMDRHTRVRAVSVSGDWVCVESDAFEGTAWVLTCIPDRTLLVPSSKGGAQAAASRRAAEDQENVRDNGAPPRFAVNAAPPAMAAAPTYAGNPDPSRFVTIEEHEQLRFKVVQLEADMRALRLLLRSWSLDAPAAS